MKSKLQIQNIKVALFTFLMTVFSITCHSQGCSVDQSTAVFYTKASGDFSNPSIWEYQDSCGNWVEATLPPWIQNTCIIRSLTNSDVFIPQFINSLVIESGGSLTIESELTISDGSGGAGGTGGTGSGIQISGNVVISHQGRLLDSSDAPLNILSGGTLTHHGHLLKPKDEILNIHSGGNVIGTGAIEIKGTMTIHGQYDGALGKLTFNGTSAQMLDHSPAPGSPPSNFGELVFNNTEGGITVIGNTIPIVAREAKSPSISEVVLTKSMDIAGPVFINPGSLFTVTATGELSVGGDMTVLGQYNGVDGKLTFDGTTPQVITYDPPIPSPQSNFGNVSFSNTSASGVQITGSAIAIWLSKKGYDYYKASSDITMAFQESFTIAAGATMEVIGSADITVGSDWTNNGTFIPGTGTVSFNSSGTSKIGGTTSPQTFYNLEVNKDSLLDVVFLDCDMLVTNDLTVTKGRIRKFPPSLFAHNIMQRLSISPSGIFEANSLDVFVSGDMTVRGQYDGALGKLTFDGSSAQVLDHSPDLGSPPSNFGELVFDNPSTVQVGGTRDINALKKHTKTGHVTLLKRTAATESFRIDAGAIVTTGPLVEVSVGGDMTVHGQYDGALGKLTFDGSSAQVLDYSPDLGSPPSNFGEVVYDNPSTVQVGGSGDINALKKHTKTGHVTLLKRTAATESFRIDAGAIVTTGPLVEVSVGGDMTVHGQYDGALGKLTFDGSSARVLDHSPDLGSLPSNFGEIVYDNPSVAGVTVQGNEVPFVSEKKEFKGHVTLLKRTAARQSVVIDALGDVIFGNSIEFSVGGNWTNNGGAFDPGTSTVIFNGAENSIIDGTSSTQDFNNLTVNKSSGTASVRYECAICHARTITIQAGNLDAGAANDIFVSGDWINEGGTFIPRTGTVSFFGGDGDSHIGGTALSQDFHKVMVRESPTLASTGQTKRTVCSGSTTSLHVHDIEISALASFDSGTALDIEVAGDWINNGGTFIPRTGTVSFYGGDGDKRIIARAPAGVTHEYHRIRFRESPTLASTGQTTRTVCTEGIATLRAHDIEISAYASFDSGTATLIELTGDMTNDGEFIPNASEVKFTCLIVPCTRSSNGGLRSTNFHKLTVDNQAGLEIRESPSFPKLTTVSGDLKLTNGKIYLYGGQDLQLVSNATITGASPTRYIITSGQGSLIHDVPLINPPLFYPIGTEFGYSPVTVSFGSITTPGALKIKANPLNPSQLSSLGISATNNVSTFFTVAKDDTLAFSDCTMTYSWDASLATGDSPLYKGEIRPISSPLYEPNVVARTPTSITLDGIIDFGEVFIGEPNLSHVVNLKLFIEGYYIGGGAMASVKNNQEGGSLTDEVEEITVKLHNAAPPYNELHTTTATLKTDGTAVCTFTTAPVGSFYIALTSRIAVGTWSAMPQTVGTTPLNFDFSSAQTQAYTDGSQPSVVEVEPGVWAMYSGDMNQDDSIDASDASAVSNDSDAAEFGILATDLNGDGSVDASDASLGSNNSDAGIFAQRSQ